MKRKYSYLELAWLISAATVYGISLALPLFIAEQIYLRLGIFAIALMIPVCFYLFLFIIIVISGTLRQMLPEVKEGVYALDDRKGIMNWLLHTGIVNFILVPHLENLIRSNPFLNSIYYKLMGAKIHPTAIISYDVKIIDPFMIEIGEGAKIGRWVKIAGHYADENCYVLGRVKVGRNALIGGDCILAPDSSVGDSSVLLGKSYTLPGMHIPQGEIWGGMPARFKKKIIEK